MNESFPSLSKESGKKDFDTWFDIQFNNIETLNADGREVRVLDISPQGEAKSEVPVVITGGYATYSPSHNKVNMSEMVRHGRRTLFVDEPRGIELHGDKERPDDIEEFFLKQTEAMLTALEENLKKRVTNEN